MLTPTDEQLACIKSATSGTSLMIEAFAGCAKSSTLEMMAPQIRQPALALAFNKKIADELQKRLPPNFQAKTLNSLGHGAWIRANSQVTRWQLDASKTSKLVTQVSREAKIKLLDGQWAALREFVEQAMLACLPVDDAPVEAWAEVAPDAIALDELEMMTELAKDILKLDIELARHGQLSFDDQIYCPLVLGGQWPKYPVILGDETQDWSLANHQMVQECLRADARLMVVGDSRQSIYQFRGAHSKSMAQLRNLRPEWSDLPLTMTFRCPKAIVARQQGHAPGYRAFEGNPQGQFERWSGWSHQQLLALANGRPIAILCRNVTPLMSLAFKLLRRNVGCQVAGRDIGRGLIALAKRLANGQNISDVELAKRITDWAERESSLAIANKQEHKLDSISDRAEALQAVLASSGCKSSQDLESVLDNLFARAGCQITLSTIHRAKGLEWPVVVHLDPWRIPSKFAKRSGDPIALEQEANLRYVAETRTRDILIEAEVEKFGSQADV